MRKLYILELAAALWLCMAGSVSAEILHMGMRGAAVESLQNDLVEAGYLARTVDGDYGSTTVKAVSEFQKDHGLPVTGKADDSTQAKLKEDDGKGYRDGGGIVFPLGGVGVLLLHGTGDANDKRRHGRCAVEELEVTLHGLLHLIRVITVQIAQRRHHRPSETGGHLALVVEATQQLIMTVEYLLERGGAQLFLFCHDYSSSESSSMKSLEVALASSGDAALPPMNRK